MTIESYTPFTPTKHVLIKPGLEKWKLLKKTSGFYAGFRWT